MEIIENLNTFRCSCFHLQDPAMNNQIETYIENITYSRNYHSWSTNEVKTMHSIDVVDRICDLFSNESIRFFSCCKVGISYD